MKYKPIAEVNAALPPNEEKVLYQCEGAYQDGVWKWEIEISQQAFETAAAKMSAKHVADHISEILLRFIIREHERAQP